MFQGAQGFQGFQGYQGHGVQGYQGHQCYGSQGSIVVNLPKPSPSEEEMNSYLFKYIWDVIKTWDIKIPEYDYGHSGANGSHVKLIMDGIKPIIRDEKIDQILSDHFKKHIQKPESIDDPKGNHKNIPVAKIDNPESIKIPISIIDI